MALLTCPVDAERSLYDIDMVFVDECLVFVSWDKRNESHVYIVELIKRLCDLQGLTTLPHQHIRDGVLVEPCLIRYQIGLVKIEYSWTRTPWLL